MRRRHILLVFSALLLAAYLAVLLPVSLEARFAVDDPMNMALCLKRGWRSLLVGQVIFFGSYLRPAGNFFYLALCSLFGPNPLPYRVFITGLLVLNAFLAWYVGFKLTRSTVTALIAASLTGYHTAMFALYYNTSQVYDVLCFFFWFAAFAWYIRIRLRGQMLNKWQITGLLATYIAALNSKEMGVTLPVMLLAFEIFARNRVDSNAAGRAHFSRVAIPIIVLGLATVVFIIGKSVGPGAISKMEAYRPVYTAGRFLDRNAHFASELFYLPTELGKAGLLCVWLVMGYVALRKGRADLRWAWVLAVTGALPVSFVGDRGGACLYIPAFGYALIVASVLSGSIRAISQESLFRWLRVSHARARLGLTVLALATYGEWLFREQRNGIEAWRRSQDLTWNAIAEMQRLGPSIRPGEKLIFLNSPFPDWDMHFIAQIVLNEPNLSAVLAHKQPKPLNAEELAQADHVFTYENGRLKLIR